MNARRPRQDPGAQAAGVGSASRQADSVRDVAGLDPPVPRVALPGNIIDDTIIDALDGKRMPFQVPAYTDSAPNDQISLFLNGDLAGLAYGSDVDPVNGVTMSIDLNRFQFTGRCVISYEVQDTTAQNISYSDFLVLQIVRKHYPGPDTAGAKYPPPTFTPASYSAAQLNSNTDVHVIVAYDDMVATDIIQLYFDLYATTSDKPQNYFYTIQPPQQNGAAKGSVVFTMPSKTFANIDENIGYLYYVVYPKIAAAARLLELQSQRTAFTVDTVPPFT